MAQRGTEALLAGLLMVATAACHGQEPITTLKIQTRVVAVAAVVLDEKGLPVRDLAKSDFELKQDGKAQEIRYFSEDSDLPLTLALMVDTSGSEKSYLQTEIIASEVFFKAMMRRPTDRAELIQFDAGVRLVQGMTASAQTLTNSLGYLALPRGATMDATRGGTKLYDAIVAGATASIGKDRGRRAMVILTDGEDVGSAATLDQAVAAAQRADVVVYSVMIGEPEQHTARSPSFAYGPRGTDVMKNISGATGGRMFIVSRQMPLKDIYELIEEDLRLQYQLGYTPPEAKPGSYHKIELKVEGKKMTVQARKGFYTPQ